MPVNELNKRIDTLVGKLDELVDEVQTQGRLRKELSDRVEGHARLLIRVTALVGVVMLFFAVGVLVIAMKTSRAAKHESEARSAQDRHISCTNQNNTRSAVRNLLEAAQNELSATKPPPDLTKAQLDNYNDQVARAKLFYRNQIAKVAPLKC